MGIFAKLFEREGEQALVMKDIHEEGRPAISVCFETDSGLFTTTLGYKNEEMRDAAFDAATDESTWALVEACRAGFNTAEFNAKEEEE